MDLIGKNFGRWKVLSRNQNRGKHPYWQCICECGKARSVNQSSLITGLSKSCGCLSKEVTAATGRANRVHGGAGSATYRIWQSMIQRCRNSNLEIFKYYGGKGITVCDEWLDYSTFLRDMGERPKGRSIDRIDGGKGYYKDNCRWATNKEQSRNIRTNRNVTYNGVEKSLSQWCEELNLNYQAVHSRLTRYGWAVNKALSTPTRLSMTQINNIGG